MKNTLRTVMILIVGILALTSCGAGYFITSEPDIVIYDDGSARSAQILHFLYYYGTYSHYRDPYYMRPVPPPPPHHKNPPQPRHEPRTGRQAPPPQRGHDVRPQRENPQPPMQRPEHGGGNQPRSGSNPRRVK